MPIICSVEDIPLNGSRGFALDSRSFFAVRNDDGLYVYRNSCPHLGVELEWVEDQFLDGDGIYIQCSNHGALFTASTGECVVGPCRGEFLQSVPFSIIDGRLIVENTGQEISR